MRTARQITGLGFGRRMEDLVQTPVPSVEGQQQLIRRLKVGTQSVAAAGLGFGQLDGTQRLLLVAAPLVYILGVQLSTFTINVPLNNRLQALNVDTMDEVALKAARMDFEPRWNLWNLVRTPFASLASVLLIVLLFQL